MRRDACRPCGPFRHESVPLERVLFRPGISPGTGARRFRSVVVSAGSAMRSCGWIAVPGSPDWGGASLELMIETNEDMKFNWMQIVRLVMMVLAIAGIIYAIEFMERGIAVWFWVALLGVGFVGLLYTFRLTQRRLRQEKHANEKRSKKKRRAKKKVQ